MLLSLLPGCSLTDIMSCATAQSVKTLLVAKIQAFKIAASKVSRFVDLLELTEVYSFIDYKDVWVLILRRFYGSLCECGFEARNQILVLRAPFLLLELAGCPLPKMTANHKHPHRSYRLRIVQSRRKSHVLLR